MVSMPSGFMSNVSLAYDERKKIWDTYSPDRQTESAALYSTPSTTSTSTAAASKTFSSLGDDKRIDLLGKTAAGISAMTGQLSESTAKGFISLVNTDSMTSAVFVAIKQGENDTASGDDALQKRGTDAYTTAANAYGGSSSHGMLGYDKNGDGFLNNESELFGFGDRGLKLSDFLSERNVADNDLTDGSDDSYTTYDLKENIGYSSTTIDQSKFMLLTSTGGSASVVKSSTATGTPDISTSSTLNLFSGFKKGEDVASVTIDVNT
jgi:hypothetical protein